MINTSPNQSRLHAEQCARLKHLQSEQIQMIDEALDTVGEYGEVRLMIEKGQIRFMEVTRSYDTLKWRPGSNAAMDK
jgi:hypothetical protein